MFRNIIFHLLLCLGCGSAWASINCGVVVAESVTADSDALKKQISVIEDVTTTQILIPLSFKNEPFVWAVVYVGNIEAPQAIIPLDAELKDDKYRLYLIIEDPNFKAVIRISYGEQCGYFADIKIGT